MIRTVLYENALRAHRLRIFERLPGAPIPCPLEELDEVNGHLNPPLMPTERTPAAHMMISSAESALNRR